MHLFLPVVAISFACVLQLLKSPEHGCILHLLTGFSYEQRDWIYGTLVTVGPKDRNSLATSGYKLHGDGKFYDLSKDRLEKILYPSRRGRKTTQSPTKNWLKRFLATRVIAPSIAPSCQVRKGGKDKIGRPQGSTAGLRSFSEGNGEFRICPSYPSGV